LSVRNASTSCSSAARYAKGGADKVDANALGRRTGFVNFDLDGLVSTTSDDKGPVVSVQLGIQFNPQLLIGRAREHELGVLDQLAEHGKQADLGRHYLFSLSW